MPRVALLRAQSGFAARLVNLGGIGLFLLGTAAGCSGTAALEIVAPRDGAFLADAAPIEVRVRAEREHDVRLTLDGGDPLPLERDPDTGELVAMLPSVPGRHVLEATLSGIPGPYERREIFVARAPGSPVDGYGFSPDGMHAVTLADGAPSHDGLYAGTLEVFSLTTSGEPFHRVLASRGVAAVISTGGDVAWLDRWSGGRGTLHVAPLGGAERVRVDDVRHVAFSRDGAVVGILDDGVLVAAADGSFERRIALSSRVFVFAGAGRDVAAFDGEPDDDVRWLTLASAPDYAPAALAAPVRPVIASSPVRREAAFHEWSAGGAGPLVLVDFETLAATRPFASVAGFTFSRDGAWLLALADPADGSASLGLLRRDVEDPAPVVVDGGFVRAGFDRDAARLLAIDEAGNLHAGALDADPLLLAPVASGVADFLALPNDRVLLLTESETLAVLDSSGAVTMLGAWNPEHREVALSPDGNVLVFTTIDGARAPVRRVDLVYGHAGDLGEDAFRPVALAGGAVAWAERSSDGTASLWLLPTFPASISGARRLSGHVDATDPFPVSPDGARMAVVADDRVLCLDAGAHVVDLGPADARHDAFFLPDGRLVRFGLDRGERRVLFVQRCGT